jgi:hypothetical protein
LSCVLCVCTSTSVRQWALSALGAKHGAPFFGHSSEQKSTLCVCRLRRARSRTLAAPAVRIVRLALLALIYAHCNFSVSFQLIFFATAPVRQLGNCCRPGKKERKRKMITLTRAAFFSLTDCAGEDEQMGQFWEIDLTFTASDI